jgi:alkylhydroperoxidase family enzyme
MESRFSLPELNADLYRRMAALTSAVENCGLDHQLLELIKMRASQIGPVLPNVSPAAR